MHDTKVHKVTVKNNEPLQDTGHSSDSFFFCSLNASVVLSVPLHLKVPLLDHKIPRHPDTLGSCQCQTKSYLIIIIIVYIFKQ